MSLILDNFEYANDAAAQAAYVTSDASGADSIEQLVGSDPRPLGDSGGTEHRVGQSFTLDVPWEVIEVQIYFVANTGAPVGDVIVRIETDSAGLPSGSLAHANASKTITPAQNQWNVWTFASSFVLPAGYYWIITTCNNQADNVRWNVYHEAFNNLYTEGILCVSLDGGSSWSAPWPLRDMTFKLIGIATHTQCYSENTIIQQGSYSLKVVARKTDSLNDTLTKSGLSIDLSGRNELKIDFYALRTGTNIQIQIHDSGGQTSTKDIAISSSNEWETITWDISGIADANKDDIDSIIIKIIEASADNTFYVDNFYAVVATLELYDINNDFRNAILELKDADNKFNSAIEIKSDINNDARFLAEVIKNINSKFNSAIEVIKDIINDFRSALPTTEGIADYMEYATDGEAQSNYISSKILSYDVLDEDCSSLTAWTKTNFIDGDTTQETYDSKSTFKMYAGTQSGTSATMLEKNNFSSALNGITKATLELNLYLDTIDILGTSALRFNLRKSLTSNFSIHFASDGLFVYDGSTYNEVGTDLVVQDQWQKWRFEFDLSSGTVDVYLNEELKASNISGETIGIAGNDNLKLVMAYGESSLGYIDYIKIGTGFPSSYLQCYSEDTIIQEGSHSLKIESGTDSLNETLTKSNLTSNLTNRNEIKLYVRSDRTGTNIQVRIHDLGGTWSTKDINITQTDVFQEFKWNISGIATADKDYIDKIEFKIINADSDTIYYIDYFTSEEQLYNINNKFNSAIRALSDISNDFRSIIEVLKDVDNKFNSAIEIKKDIINNDFRNAIRVLSDISNDSRLAKETLKDINNDFRTAIGGLFGILNDFRSAIEAKINITNEFRMLIGVNFDNKFNSAIRVLSDVTIHFASAIGALIDMDNDVRTYKLVIPNINNNFRMIISWQITPH